MIISCKNLMLDLKAPPSKSVYHRELIVNYILGARGEYLDIKDDDNNDVAATKMCLMSIRFADEGEDIFLHAGESGSTLRFMIPVALALEGAKGRRMVFETAGRLIDRPIDDLAKCLEPHGVTITRNKDDMTFTAEGVIGPGEYKIDGSVSSQYVTGLLLALSSFEEKSTVEVIGGMSSVHYIELTSGILNKYGAKVVRKGNVFEVSGKKGVDTPSGEFDVEGDWSNGAFLLSLGSLMKNGGAMISGLLEDSVQGDKAILTFLHKLGIDVGSEDGVLTVFGDANAPMVDEITFECDDVPDIAPYMAVVGAFKAKQTVLTGIGRLRVKESDRAAAICDMLKTCGIEAVLGEDVITITGADRKSIPEEISLTSSNDHRMAMAAVLCAAGTGRKIDIDDISCLSKSFPEFRNIIEKEMSVL